MFTIIHLTKPNQTKPNLSKCNQTLQWLFDTNLTYSHSDDLKLT